MVNSKLCCFSVSLTLCYFDRVRNTIPFQDDISFFLSVFEVFYKIIHYKLKFLTKPNVAAMLVIYLLFSPNFRNNQQKKVYFSLIQH